MWLIELKYEDNSRFNPHLSNIYKYVDEQTNKEAKSDSIEIVVFQSFQKHATKSIQCSSTIDNAIMMILSSHHPRVDRL